MIFRRKKWPTVLRFFHSRKKRKSPFKSIKGEIFGRYEMLDIRIPLKKQETSGIEVIWLRTRD